MKKELKNLGQILYRKELKNEELKNSIGGKGYTCGGFMCDWACTKLNGDRKCATGATGSIENPTSFLETPWGCSGGSTNGPCYCLSGVKVVLCE